MKKILMLILSCTMAFGTAALVGGCGKGDASGSAGESSVVEQAKDVSVTFTVKDQDALTIANVKVTFTDENDDTVSATSDANGQFTITLKEGEYSVSYDNDYETLGGYYLPETMKVTVEEAVTSMVLRMTNNTPNGTLGREFSLSVDENEIVIPANTSYYYIVYRAVNLYADIEGEGAKVTYRETEYVADESGKIAFALLGTSTNSAEILLIENTTATEQAYKVTVQAAPGSQTNPYALTLDEDITTKALVSGENVYYTYTATTAGTLQIAIKTEKSYVSMTNASNSLNANTKDDEDGIIELTVNEGDEIIIVCSALIMDDSTESASFHATFTAEEKL